MAKIKPGPGQESVWDYPRPPKIEATGKRIRIVSSGITLVDTTSAFRVLETSHPPTYYIPPKAITMKHLRLSGSGSFCEFKGGAHYYDLVIPGVTVPNIAWGYANPSPAFAPIADFLAFYPSKLDECFVGDDKVVAQEGDFYGGWITKDIVGPFKGGAGTWGW